MTEIRKPNPRRHDVRLLLEGTDPSLVTRDQLAYRRALHVSRVELDDDAEWRAEHALCTVVTPALDGGEATYLVMVSRYDWDRLYPVEVTA